MKSFRPVPSSPAEPSSVTPAGSEPVECLLSVVIPTFQAPALAITAAEALLPIPAWAEVILVDDASGDDTVARVRETCPDVVAIELEQNLGFGGAVNTGFQAARGRYLATVNNDVVASWDSLAVVVAHLENKPNAGAAAPGLSGATGEHQRVAFNFPMPLHQKLLRGRNRLPHRAASPYPVDYAKGACVLFRRTALEQVGLFDQQYWMFAEEIDLFRRLADAGWQTWVVPQAAVVHGEGQTTRNHPDRKTSTKFRTQSYRSMCRYWDKHHSWLDRLVMRGEMMARVAGRIVGATFSAVLKRNDPWWIGEHARCLMVLLRRWPSQPDEPRLEPRDSARATRE